MGGLNATLNIGVDALDAAQGAMDAVSNNISNANTPGYTEETAQLSEDALNQSGGQVTGGGVTLDSIQSVQDELLDLQIQAQTSLQSSASTASDSLDQIQTYFTTTGTDIASTLTSLSSSLAALSADPSSASAQQSVLSAAQDLADSFNTTANGLTSTQSSANSLVTSSVAQINSLTQQIAQLNGQVGQQTASGQSDGSTVDDLNEMELQLAGLTGISVTTGSNGEDTITTGNGTPLVMGTQSFTLQTTTGSDGLTQVLDSNGNNITSTISGGQLGGAIQVANQTIPGLLSQLNSLASQFAGAFNTAQEQGVTSSGAQGQALFTLPSNLDDAAAGIGVALTSASQLAINTSATSATSAAGDLSASTALTAGSVTTITDAATGATFTYTAASGDTLGDLQTAIAAAADGSTLPAGATVTGGTGTLSAGTALTLNASGQAVIATPTSGDTLQVSTNDSALGGSFSANSNSNIANLSAVLTNALPSGQTAAGAYASLVFDVGNAASNASTDSSAIGTNLLSLTDQQSSVSGVNIDTETANLIRYQTAYEAGARIVSTIQQLDTDTMDMGSSQSY